MSEAWDNVALKFKSANHIPVERATVTRDEFLAIEKERQAGLDALVVAYQAIPITEHGTENCPLCKIQATIESVTGLPIDEVLK